jgi:hypothetical protein
MVEDLSCSADLLNYPLQPLGNQPRLLSLIGAKRVNLETADKKIEGGLSVGKEVSL